MNFKEQIAAKREAAKSPEPEPEPAPEPEFTDPAVRAEYLADELRDAQAELAKEKARREEAEQKLVARKPTLQQSFTKRRRFK